VEEEFNDDAEIRFNMEITMEEDIDCDICWKNFERSKHDKIIPVNQVFEQKLFYSHKMTLLEYFKHEVMHEFERAKRCIFDKEFNLVKVKNEDGRDPEVGVATFHPVFLSSLMN
jgi:hypothetical protein